MGPGGGTTAMTQLQAGARYAFCATIAANQQAVAEDR